MADQPSAPASPSAPPTAGPPLSTADAARQVRSPLRALLAGSVRAVALGAATGGRSTAGPVAVALTSRAGECGPAGLLGARAGRAAVLVLAAVELVVDTLPVVPPRTAAAGLVPRIASAVFAAGSLAARDHGLRAAAGPAALAAAAAAGAAFAGARLRGIAAPRFGSDLPGALVEDCVVAVLARVGAGARPAAATRR